MTYEKSVERFTTYQNCICYGKDAFVSVGLNGYINHFSKYIFGTKRREYQVSNVDWQGVCYGKKYVAVGHDGYITISANGQDWSDPIKICNKSLFSVHYINDKYIVTGTDGLVMYSNDAILWEDCSIPNLMSAIRDLTYANGSYIAIGCGGTIAESTDLSFWTITKLASTNRMSAATAIDNTAHIVSFGCYITKEPTKSYKVYNAGVKLFDIGQIGDSITVVGDNGLIRSNFSETTYAVEDVEPFRLRSIACNKTKAIVVGDSYNWFIKDLTKN